MEQANTKFNSKKKRRLEKYIVRSIANLNITSDALTCHGTQDKKLKKEERVHLLEKLACVMTYFSHTRMQS